MTPELAEAFDDLLDEFGIEYFAINDDTGGYAITGELGETIVLTPLKEAVFERALRDAGLLAPNLSLSYNPELLAVLRPQ